MIRISLQSTLTQSDVLILPTFQGQNVKSVLSLFGDISSDAIVSFFETGDFEGKFLQNQLIYTGDKNTPRVYLLGLGFHEDFSVRKLKQAFGSAIIAAQSKKAKTIAIVLPPEMHKGDVEQTLQSAVIGIETAAYAYDDHRAISSRVHSITECQFISAKLKTHLKEMKKGVESGSKIAQSINWTRSLGNTPPSIMTPLLLATEAQMLAQKNNNVKVKILSEREIEKLKMGCFLGVAKGSQHEGKFIIAEYWGGKKSDAPTLLVGKGITYDSGGLSLKPGDSMIDMKFDMLGGATVLGIVRAAAALKLKRNIVALVPACENMPSGTAYRPDDILTAMNGTTVLVENTDAEGRLILADALCYAARYNPKEVIDFATLTGACVVALGNERSGLFTDLDTLATELDAASKKVGEHLWRLPVGEEYTEAIKSEVADIKNLGGVGGPRYAGASTAAAFLQYFTRDTESGDSLYPWAHIDLSCSYYGGKGKAWIRGGANGFGIETLIEYLKV